MTYGETLPTAVHSNSTVSPTLDTGIDSKRTGKVIGNFTNPPTTRSPSRIKKITISPKNASLSSKNISVPPKTVAVLKSTKAYIKKIDFFFHNVTLRNKTNDKETVINLNETNTSEPSNVTESQLLINSSFSEVPHTDNLTYLQEEVNSIQNMEKIELEEVDEKKEGTEALGSNLSAAGITGISLGCVVIVGILCGVSYFIYHNRGFNRPQVLNDHCSNPDSSGYIDDASVRVSKYWFFFLLRTHPLAFISLLF